VYQAILPGTHISLTGVSIPHLDCVISVVLLFSFLGELMPLLISRDDLLTLRSYNLGSFSTLQEGGILYYHLISKSLDVFQLLLLLLHNPLPFVLCLSLGLLSCMLYMMGLYCLLQMKEGLLLLLIPSLYFMVLLFKHFSIMLRNVGEGRERHNNVEEKTKTFFSIYVLLT